jgi:serine/threonine-protein kinase
LDLTAVNSILGTISYMAPEQLMAGTIDPRTDLFALAAIVYEMLSGGMAFGGSENIAELAEKVLRHQPPPIDGVPLGLSQAVLKGLSKQPGDRPQSVANFMTTLADIAKDSEEVTDRGLEVPPPDATPTGPAALPSGEHGLPELPGDATSITQLPDDAPAELTRITKPSSDGSAAGMVVHPHSGTIIAPGPEDPGTTRITQNPLDLPPSTITKRTPLLSRSVVDWRSLLGSRRGIVLGAVVGMVLAIVLSVLLR